LTYIYVNDLTCCLNQQIKIVVMHECQVKQPKPSLSSRMLFFVDAKMSCLLNAFLQTCDLIIHTEQHSNSCV